MQQRLEAFVRTFTQDTILAIPWPVQYGFSPGNIQSLGVLGTLYPNIRISQGT